MPKTSKKSKTPKVFISVTICGDDEIQKLNKKYLGRDFTTDVLSFKIGEIMKDGTEYLGEIVVNSEQAERQAYEYGNDTKREIAELIEHGALHLFDIHHKHDDEEDVHGVKIKKESK